MAQKRFGGRHTVEKLAVLERYLASYVTALRYQSFSLVYIDAFAGTGEIPMPAGGELFDDVEEVSGVIEGSAQRAMRMVHPFDKYVFIEARANKARELIRWRSQLPKLGERVEVFHGDANRWLARFCAQTHWQNTRAVLFLDPFGNQVEWTTLIAVARTKAIDMWYLFPAGLGVNRQIGRDGVVLPEHAASLDRIFGPNPWRDAFLGMADAPDLFGHTSVRKQTDADRITKFMIECLKKEFEGGVVDGWLPLGRGGAHWYSLLFAWANPSPKAALAGKLAAAIMSRS